MQVWRSDDVPRPARVEYMRQAICDSIVPFDLRLDHGMDGSGEIRSADVGMVRVSYHQGGELDGEVVRTPWLIRRSDPALCKIDLQLSGHTVFEQDDRARSICGPATSVSPTCHGPAV
ncbi:MAG: hypothetical protein GEV03_18665 [Streptosporangiales bacterium]|nr:hypothetical protein [Streptosporangiales bacterium]